MAARHPRICADVATYPPEKFTGAVGLICSPPCTAWSSAGKRLARADQPRIFAHLADVTRASKWIDYPCGGWADSTSPLVLEVVRWIDALRPAWFCCEQVEAVLPFWRAVARWARGLGYGCWADVVSAETFGAPQTRRRAILTGHRDSRERVPMVTHQAYRPGVPMVASQDLFGGELKPWVSMAEALGWGLPDRPAWTVTSGGTATGGAEVFGNAKCRERLREVVYRNGNQEHSARRGLGEPAPAVHFGARSNKVEWMPGDLAGDPSASGRRVTVEEAAILQGFRPDYPWRGSKTSRYQQVGNAIPVQMASAILRAVLT